MMYFLLEAITVRTAIMSLDKTKILSQEVSRIPNIKIGDHLLEVVEEFTYLGSTIASNLSLDCELSRRIRKAATLMSRLTKRVWDNPMLTVSMQVYRACVLSTLLYGSESWTPYSRQEQRLNVFHMRNLRRILHITWQDRISNKSVLEHAGLPSMFALLAQRRLRWLGHTRRMKDDRLPKSYYMVSSSLVLDPSDVQCYATKT